MNLKKLIKRVEFCQEEIKAHSGSKHMFIAELVGIRQTVEVVNHIMECGMQTMWDNWKGDKTYKNWQKLKELLEIKWHQKKKQ